MKNTGIIEEIVKYKFTICPKTCTQKLELNAHIKDHFRTYHCSLCKEDFIGDKNYSYHLQHVTPPLKLCLTGTKSEDSH